MKVDNLIMLKAGITEIRGTWSAEETAARKERRKNKKVNRKSKLANLKGKR